jgi:hypothetical protein
MAAPSRAKKKKRRRAFQAHGKKRRPGDLHTIPTFCAANGISESFYHKLKRQGRGPREIQLYKRVLISPEAETAWRQEREQETALRRSATSGDTTS